MTGRRMFVPAALAAAMVLGLATLALVRPTVPAAHADSDVNWKVTLLASNEVPPAASNVGGRGSFRATKSGVFTFQLSIHNPDRETVVAAHLHRGMAGMNGPVVVTLLSGASDDREHIVIAGKGVVSAGLDPKELAEAVSAHPERWYINVHTTAHPPGAARGQLGS